MNMYGFCFFEISDDLGQISSDVVAIQVDHEVLMSIKGRKDWDMLHAYEGLFAIWYQEQMTIGKMDPSPTFLIIKKLLEPYDQESICQEIMEMLEGTNL
jgi:hypothetical protein